MDKRIRMQQGKVIGLGGVFIKFRDPAKMRTWYREVLGLNTNDYGILFRFNHQLEKPGSLQLGTFESSSNYFGADSQQVMLNFRVENMETLREELSAKGVVIVNEIESYEYGKFLHIQDPEGNRVELWEPVDEVFENTETFSDMN